MNYKIGKLLVLIARKQNNLEVDLYVGNDLYLDSFNAPIAIIEKTSESELGNIIYKRMNSGVYNMFSEGEKSVYASLIAEKIIINAMSENEEAKQINNFEIFA